MAPPRHQQICERSLTVPASRRKRAGLLQRDIAARLGVRAEVVSSTETERAKRMATRDSYEELVDRIEGREIGD